MAVNPHLITHLIIVVMASVHEGFQCIMSAYDPTLKTDESKIVQQS